MRFYHLFPLILLILFCKSYPPQEPKLENPSLVGIYTFYNHIYLQGNEKGVFSFTGIPASVVYLVKLNPVNQPDGNILESSFNPGNRNYFLNLPPADYAIIGFSFTVIQPAPPEQGLDDTIQYHCLLGETEMQSSRFTISAMKPMHLYRFTSENIAGSDETLLEEDADPFRKNFANLLARQINLKIPEGKNALSASYRSHKFRAVKFIKIEDFSSTQKKEFRKDFEASGWENRIREWEKSKFPNKG